MYNIYYLFASFAVSCFLLPNLIILMRRSFLDSPSFRSSHSIPTPRGGGIVFVLSPLISYLILIPFLGTAKSQIFLPYFSLLPVFLVGLIDDKYNLPPLIKFFPQFLTCVSLLFFKSWSFQLLSFPLHDVLWLLTYFLLLLSMVLFVNLVNFTDGLDGLVSLSFLLPIFVALSSTSSTTFDWLFFGSLISFLFYNWSPAKIFMGDCGSLFIGSYYLLIAMRASSMLHFLTILSLVSPLIFDAMSCLIRRLISKQNIFQAHNQHLFQRLHLAGWTHSKISIIYASFSILLSISLLFHSYSLIIFLLLLQFPVGYWLNKRYAVPFDSFAIG